MGPGYTAIGGRHRCTSTRHGCGPIRPGGGRLQRHRRPRTALGGVRMVILPKIPLALCGSGGDGSLASQATKALIGRYVHQAHAIPRGQETTRRRTTQGHGAKYVKSSHVGPEEGCWWKHGTPGPSVPSTRLTPRRRCALLRVFTVVTCQRHVSLSAGTLNTGMRRLAV